MKRFATAVVAAIVVSTGAVGAAAEPGGFAGVEQFAEADWIVVHGRDRATMFFAFGIRSLSETGLQTIGVVGKGKCSIERGKHFVMMMCQGGGRGHSLEMDQLQFDPALRSASMSFTTHGERHRVRWTGKGQVPWTGGQVVGGDGHAGAAAAMARSARANARLFGRRMPRRINGFSFAGLFQGATAAAWLEGRDFRIAPDGSYSYTATFRIPR